MRAVTHPSAFNPYPLALLAAAFVTGIFFAHLFSLPLPLCLSCGAGSFVLAVAACAAQKRATLTIAIAFVLAGAALTATTEAVNIRGNRLKIFYDEKRIASGDPVELAGVVERAPESAPDGFYLAIRLEKIRFKEEEHEASGAVQLFAPVRSAKVRAEYDTLELRRGARLRVLVALTRAENFRNPGGTSLTQRLEQRGLDATGLIKSPLLIERLEDERVFLPLLWLDEWRSRLLAEIDELFTANAAGVLKAALLGNRYGLSRAAAERFREGGTFHVLVISGLHITFIGGLALACARRAWKQRAWQFAMSVMFIWAYALAVGAESSVVRAALMFTAVALAPVLHRPSGGPNALGGAALALLAWQPRDLFDPSFQLTFLSVLIIITLAQPLLLKLKEVGEWRPTRTTPYPPVCPGWWRALGEMLFWSERRWKCEMAHTTWSYQLFKTPLAARLERSRMQRPLRYAFVALIVSGSVQIGLLPLLILYFHRFSLASFVLNVFVGALVALLSLSALAALALSQASAASAAPFIWLAQETNRLMLHSVDPFTQLGIASLRLPAYTGRAAAVYVLYFVPLIVLICKLACWRTLIRAPRGSSVDGRNSGPLALPLAALAVLLVVILTHPFSASQPDGKLHVDFLDVGQGDAALITMPDGTTLLIDGGGRPRFRTGDLTDKEEGGVPFERDGRSIGDAVVSEYLWWRGLDRVDYLLATHTDADHMDGLNDIARNFKVRAALVARAPVTGDAEYARFAATMTREGVPVYLIGRGDTLRFGAAAGEILWPPAASATRPATSHNDDSVVLRLRFGEKVVLFTGDIEGRAEAALLAAQEDLRCDAIKVAHHGSLTSSAAAFVAATRPSVAIISVGLSSQYGHPHRPVVERWRASGAETLTTGKHGTITLSIDGRDLKVETYVRE